MCNSLRLESLTEPDGRSNVVLVQSVAFGAKVLAGRDAAQRAVSPTFVCTRVGATVRVVPSLERRVAQIGHRRVKTAVEEAVKRTVAKGNVGIRWR